MVTISEFMAEDHVKTMRMIDDFRNGWATIDQLRMAIQRHFFLEEKAVFSFRKSKDPRDIEDAMNLVKEHNDLLDLLTDIEDANAFERNKLMDEFITRIHEHSRFEDREFYPSLDRNLSYAQKLRIISRIKNYDIKTHDVNKNDQDLIMVRSSIYSGASQLNI